MQFHLLCFWKFSKWGFYFSHSRYGLESVWTKIRYPSVVENKKNKIVPLCVQNPKVLLSAEVHLLKDRTLVQIWGTCTYFWILCYLIILLSNPNPFYSDTFKRKNMIVWYHCAVLEHLKMMVMSFTQVIYLTRLLLSSMLKWILELSRHL